MKINTVTTCTDAANAIATAFLDDAYANVASPITVTVSYIDASGRARTARHTAGDPGWNCDAPSAPAFTPPF